MKKNVILVLIGILLCFVFVQCKSNEDKALALIKDNMFKTLYDFDSYQPIETKVDSAFHTPYNDSICLRNAVVCKVVYDKIEEYLEEANNALNAAEVWHDMNWMRDRYFESLNESETALTNAKTLLETSKEYEDTIRMRSNVIMKEFMGWQVTHKFRCKTKGGFSVLSTRVYYMDSKFTEILREVDPDDEEFQKYREIIENVLEGKEATVSEDLLNSISIVGDNLDK